MNPRDDLGYTKPNPEQGAIKPAKPAKPKNPIKSSIDALKRLEIKRWAEERAYRRAKELGKVRSDTDYEKMREFDAFITNESLYWEKEAYLKIHNREVNK